VFHSYDSLRKQLQWSNFRALQENGKGKAGDNDMLLNAGELTVIAMWPLYSDSGSASGNPMFAWPGKEASLSLAWPTSDGYSNLIIDMPGPGTYNFTYLAAQQEVSVLDSAVAARSSYRPSATFTTASDTAHAQLSAANSATTESQQGAHGAQALDVALHAMTTLYSEYGIQYAQSNRSTIRPQWRVTFDTITGGTGYLATVRDLFGGDPQEGWVRIVFDRKKSPSYYANEIAAAHQAGLRVVGQFLDSSDMAKVSLHAWKSRVRAYVSALPTVDEWEVGNEVNDNWLGRGVVSKVTYAANYVKTHTAAHTRCSRSTGTRRR
jgi:hypothetical protein